MPYAVAKAAAAMPLKDTKASHREFAEAGEWDAIAYGQHASYKRNTQAWTSEAAEALGLTRGITEKNVVERKGALAAHIAGWTGSDKRAAFAASKLKDMPCAKHASAQDASILKTLKGVSSALPEVEAAWARVQDGWRGADAAGRVKLLSPMAGPLRRLYDILYGAYRGYSHETDAWATGALIGKRFRSEAPKHAL